MRRRSSTLCYSSSGVRQSSRATARVLTLKYTQPSGGIRKYALSTANELKVEGHDDIQKQEQGGVYVRSKCGRSPSAGVCAISPAKERSVALDCSDYVFFSNSRGSAALDAANSIS